MRAQRSAVARLGVTWVLAALAGCFNPSPPRGLRCSEDVGCPDGEICVGGVCNGSDGDAGGPDTPPSCSFGAPAALLDPCDLPEPGPPLALGINLGQSVYDTDSEILSSPTGNEIVVPGAAIEINQIPARAIVAESINIEGQVRVVGSRALVLVSYSSLVVTGQLDLSSRVFDGPGAGAHTGFDAPSCGAALPGELAPGSPGGSGGGGFLGAGGFGGDGMVGRGGAGGPAIEPQFQGGCSGAQPSGGMDLRSPGGGAVYLLAAQLIEITGIVSAGGAGGRPAEVSPSGGGGGGSGGFIGLDAPLVSSRDTAIIAANGGGGGSAGGADFGADGDASALPAPGGISGNGDPSGGAGGAGLDIDGGGGFADETGDGGGGGGGSVGVIAVFGGDASLAGIISPRP